MMLFRNPLALLAAAVVVAAPVFAQVAPPPGPKPEPTPSRPVADEPPPPPPKPSRPALGQPAPDVPFNPILIRDNEGNIVALDQPVEYLAMSHNPLIDLRAMSQIAPFFYPRRTETERFVIENLDAMIEIENGLIETIRFEDQDAMRHILAVLDPFTTRASRGASLTNAITKAGVADRSIGALTERIINEYQNQLTAETMKLPTTDDGATGIDQMMHHMLRMSVSEYEYHYRRLMEDAANECGAVVAQLDLDEPTRAAVEPLASRLNAEGDLDARSALIRDIFARFDPPTKRRALELTIASRPSVDAAAQMAAVPDDAEITPLDDETRLEMIFQLLEGGRVNTASFIKQ